MDKKRWIGIGVVIFLAAALIWWSWSSQKTSVAPLSMKASVQTEATQEVAGSVVDWLFSPQSIAMVVEYEVQPGDSLYKIAKQYHTTIELIKRGNQLQGDVIRVGRKLKIISGKFALVVTKSKNTLSLRLDEKPIKKYSISTGKNNSTPSGQFIITDKLENPTWYKAGAIVPPDSPENILGSRWLGLSVQGYGIHGTVEPEKIGAQITAGCVRMRNSDVEELYAVLPNGTPVTIED